MGIRDQQRNFQVSAMDFKLVLIFVLLVLQESAGGKINNCDGKENGDSCLKGCKSPNCAAAKCWEGACLVKTKYDTISAIGKKQRSKKNKKNNNCEGKKDGDACFKRCSRNSEDCKKAKCCRTVCLKKVFSRI